MDYIHYEERLAYLEELASKGRLLSLAQVAMHFNCSKRTVKRMLHHRRFKGISIQYSHPLKKFVIDSPGGQVVAPGQFSFVLCNPNTIAYS